jgi:hypothetical protein
MTHLPLTKAKMLLRNLDLHVLQSSQFSNNVHSTRINHWVQTCKANKQAKTKNNTPIKRKALKERTLKD